MRRQRRARRGRFRRRRQSRVPAGRQGDVRLPASHQDRARRRQRSSGLAAQAGLQAAAGRHGPRRGVGGRGHGQGHCRDRQARGQRVSRDQDIVREHRCRPLRSHGGGHRGRDARPGHGSPDRALPPRRHRLRRLLPAQGRARVRVDRRAIRSRLFAARRGAQGQRSPYRPIRSEGAGRDGVGRRRARWRSGASRSSRVRTTCGTRRACGSSTRS